MKELDNLKKVYVDGLISQSDYFYKIMGIGATRIGEKIQELETNKDEPMIFKKMQCDYGWIVLIVKNHNYIEIHSNGFIKISKNYIASDHDLLRLLEHAALENQLKSQQPGEYGIKFPEED